MCSPCSSASIVEFDGADETAVLPAAAESTGSGSPASSVQPPEGIVIYTVKNLRDVQDAAPDVGVDATQVMRFAQGDLDAVQTGVSLMAVKPGRRQAIAHRHDEAEEVYVILSGSGRIKLDDDIVDVGPMDAIRVAPTVTRALEGGPEGIEYLAVGRHHDGDGAVVPIEEFWR